MTINYTTGYAGTGKSTKLLELLPTLPDSSVVLCPTHKAIQRLLNTAYEIEVEFKTIHSLLGWIPTINENAQHIAHIDSTRKLDKALEEYTNIVIDEAGMMSEEMLMDITSRLEEQNNFDTDHITLHLFLDPYQLLPVKGKQIEIDPLYTTNLTTQHRAESPDVIALFTKFVNFLEGTNTKDLTTPPSKNVLHRTNTDHFAKGDRLLAYTNAAVGEHNQTIAKHLGIDSYIGQEVQLGSMLDLRECDGFIAPTLENLVDMYEQGILRLQNSQINKKYVDASLHALIQEPNIEFMVDNNNFIYPVVVGIGKANKARNKAREAAIKDKKNFRWVYALNRAFTMDYSFASTVHKAQGSEFRRVWIDKRDIQRSIMNGYYGTYARLMYVAISRAKQTVFILE